MNIGTEFAGLLGVSLTIFYVLKKYFSWNKTFLNLLSTPTQICQKETTTPQGIKTIVVGGISRKQHKKKVIIKIHGKYPIFDFCFVNR